MTFSDPMLSVLFFLFYLLTAAIFILNFAPYEHISFLIFIDQPFLHLIIKIRAPIIRARIIRAPIIRAHIKFALYKK